MSDVVTNSELARRLDDIRSGMPGFVLKEVAAAERNLWESRFNELSKDFSGLESEVKQLKADLRISEDKRVDERRQYIKLFVGALLASAIPAVTLIISLTQGAA